MPVTTNGTCSGRRKNVSSRALPRSDPFAMPSAASPPISVDAVAAASAMAKLNASPCQYFAGSSGYQRSERCSGGKRKYALALSSNDAPTTIASGTSRNAYASSAPAQINACVADSRMSRSARSRSGDRHRTQLQRGEIHQHDRECKQQRERGGVRIICLEDDLALDHDRHRQYAAAAQQHRRRKSSHVHVERDQ